jgi:glycine/D-amino acid oxidase-like deaminating enzyme
VVERFMAVGGEYRQAAILGENLEGDLESGGFRSLSLSDGTALAADRVIFACGPWMGKLFSRTIGPHFISTRQEVFFFGTPEGDCRYNEGNVPVWGDHSGHFMYGIPGNQERGFKIADDTRGAEFDPTAGERLVSADGIAGARDYLAYRFPGMKNAPLLESRVCQYENTSDENFIIDRHPHNQNVWLVGGGSGHGFKHGPALGEIVAKLVLKDETSEACYRLARFRRKS